MDRSNTRTLVLASSSPRRKELIHKLGQHVVTIPADVDESTNTESPGKRVEELSLRKARAVYGKLQESEQQNPLQTPIIIGSDTIVVKGGQVLGKPRDEHEAMDMLRMLSGEMHEVYTGVALIDCATDEHILAHRQTKVYFKPLEQQQIERYVKTGEPMDKAGAYGIQGLGALFVDSIEGCYFNVVGLPLSLLGKMLTKFGVEVI